MSALRGLAIHCVPDFSFDDVSLAAKVLSNLEGDNDRPFTGLHFFNTSTFREIMEAKSPEKSMTEINSSFKLDEGIIPNGAKNEYILRIVSSFLLLESVTALSKLEAGGEYCRPVKLALAQMKPNNPLRVHFEEVRNFAEKKFGGKGLA